VTINDLRLTRQIREAHRASSRLDYLTRENKKRELQKEFLNLALAGVKGYIRVWRLK
jgi:hypothetical protein